ncbi:MAG: hypothetical protein RIT27_2307 [Pseudomonadota bacterium]|jgi:pimeloyl-ACP methyl ester carboxylesterase
MFNLLKITALLFISNLAHADIALLVHGYASDARAWERSGIVSILSGDQWQRAGILIPEPTGIRVISGVQNAQKSLYLIELPSTAPLMIQADLLHRALQWLKSQYPSQPIHLIGHSAGGVAARLALIRHDAVKVKSLTTIASPNSGTSTAEQALDLTSFTRPFAPIADFIFPSLDLLRHSEGLLFDLTRPYAGNLLHWLNVQPHPPIKYFAIVRGIGAVLLGDQLISPFSQDLNNVPAIQGDATIYTVPADHGLSPADGWTLITILRQAVDQ